MLDQLGWLVHLEVDAEHGDSQRQPAEIVVAGASLAGVGLEGVTVPQCAGKRRAISSAPARSVRCAL